MRWGRLSLGARPESQNTSVRKKHGGRSAQEHRSGHGEFHPQLKFSCVAGRSRRFHHQLGPALSVAPSCTRRPASIIATRPQRRRAWSRSWVTRTKVKLICANQIANKFFDAGLRLLVERGRWLIQQQDLGLIGQRAGERDALLFAARKGWARYERRNSANQPDQGARRPRVCGALLHAATARTAGSPRRHREKETDVA